MSILDFPSSAVTGDTYRGYRYDGVKWNKIGLSDPTVVYPSQSGNSGNVAVWVQSGQVGTVTLTNNIWYPFTIFGFAGPHNRTIAKAIYHSGRWYFDGNAWPD